MFGVSVLLEVLYKHCSLVVSEGFDGPSSELL